MCNATWNGRTQPVADWVDECKADRGVVLIRITAGWSIDRAIQEPLRNPLKHGGKNKTTPWIGVKKRSDRPGYRVRGKIGKELIQLGTYECDKEAAAVYNIWARNQRGLSAKINLT